MKKIMKKSFKLIVPMCNITLLVFLRNFFVLVSMLVCAIIRMRLSQKCEETIVWVAVLFSKFGYILHFPKISLKEYLLRN